MYEKKRAAGPSCPLCEKPNQCGMAIGAPGCWCMRLEVPATLIERIPEPLRGVVCVCEDCIREEMAKHAPAEADEANPPS